MNGCPNLKDNKNVALIERLGLQQFYRVWMEHNGEIPYEQYETPDYVTMAGNEVTVPVDSVFASSEVENIEQVNKWWAKTFEGVPLDTNYQDMIIEGGHRYMAIFNGAMVKLAKGAEKGTSFHEAFHVATYLYLNDTERNALYEEAKKIYGDLTNKQIDEVLANKFRKYMLEKGEVKEQGLIAKLFNALLNWINHIVGKTGEIDYLFQRIENGNFKRKPNAEAIKFANKLSIPKILVSKKFDIEVITYMSNWLLQTRDIANKEGVSKIPALRRTMIDYLTKRQEVQTNERIKENLGLLVDNFDDYFEKTLSFINKRFGIEIIESSSEVDDSEIRKQWDEAARFKDNFKDTMSQKVKQLFMTTHKLQHGINVDNIPLDKNGNYAYPYDQENFLGTATFIDYETILPFVARILSGSTDFQDMMDRLDSIIEFEPSLIQIKHKLGSDSSLRGAFWTTFNMQMPDVDVVLREERAGETRLNHRIANNMTKADKKLADKWSLNIQISQGNNKYTKEFYTEIANQLNAMKEGMNIAELVENTTDVMNKMGMLIPKDVIMRVLTSRIFARQFSGDDANFYSVYNNIFKEPLSKINGGLSNDSRFEDVGNLNKIAKILVNFHYELNESSYINVNGDLVYSLVKPNYLSEVFKIFNGIKEDGNTDNAKLKLKEFLGDYTQEQGMQYSNWLYGTDGFLDGNKDLNLKGLDKFTYGLFGGLKDTLNNKGFEYDGMDDKDWVLSQVFMFLKDIDKGKVSIPIPIPSDAGVTYTITSPRFKAGIGFDKGVLANDSPLLKAVTNTVLQEVSRIEAASKLMFDVNAETGVLTLRPDLDTTKLEKNFHWMKQNVFLRSAKDTEHKGRNYPTGNGFLFNNMKIVYPDGRIKTLNDIQDANGFTINEAVYRGYYNEKTHRPLIDSFIKEWIKYQFDETKKELEVLSKDGAFDIIENFEVLNRSLDKLAIELALNTYISYIEQNNFFNGLVGEYKNALDVNKRAKETISPGNGILTSRPTFKAAVIADVELESKSFKDIAKGVANSLKQFRKFESNSVDTEKILSSARSKKTQDLNDLERATYNIVNKYISINTADGQGYISIERYREILEGLGRFDGHYKKLFEKIEIQRQELSSTGKITTTFAYDELEKMLEPIKGFYYNRSFDSYLGRMVSNQIKYSTVPLIPQLVVGTDLEKIMNYMNSSKTDEIVFESAEKVGSTSIAKIADEQGNLIDGFESQIRSKELSNAFWRLQQDNPNHLMDYESNVGTQLAKLAIDNLQGNYNLDGKELASTEVVEHYMNLVAANISDDFKALASELGLIQENGIWKIDNLDMVQESLLREVRSRGLGENFEDALQYVSDDTKEFKMPLFMSSMAKKYESIILSMFDSNVRRRKQFGGIAVLFSNAFTQKKTLEEVDNGGIQWLKSYTDVHGTKLKMATVEDGKVTEIPCLLPAFSKKFFNRSKSGYTDRIDINELAKQAPELLEIIGYRIPTETKHSMTVLKVVGFLPQESGGTIVLPDEIITQSGADFDIDKLFMLTYSFYKDKAGFHKYEYIDGADKASVDRRFKIYAQYSKSLANQRKAIRTKHKIELNQFRQSAESQYSQVSKELDDVINDISGLEGQAKIDEIFKTLESENYGKLVNAIEIIESELEESRESTSALIDEVDSLESEGLYSEADVLSEQIALNLTKEKELSDKLERLYKVDDVIYSEEYADVAKQRKEIKNSIKEKKKENRKAINDEISALVGYEEFKLKSIEEQNIEVARQNRILDVFRSILQNPLHYGEIMTPNSFDKFTEVKQAQDKLNLRDVQHIEPTTFKGQNGFRKTNMAGRALKALAVNAKGFTTIGQTANIRLRENLGFQFKYTENLPELRKRYAGNIVEDTKDYIIVNHTTIGKAPDGSYLSSNGTLITDNLGSLVANTLDIVKYPLPDNINLYTFNPTAAMLMTGVEPDMASWYISQPVLQSLATVAFGKKGIISQDDNKAIQDTKNLYLRELLRVLNILNKNEVAFITGKDNKAVVTPDGKKFLRLKYNYQKDGVKNTDSVVLTQESDGSINFPRMINKGDTKVNLFETLFGYQSEQTYAPSLDELKKLYADSVEFKLSELSIYTANTNKDLTPEQLRKKATIIRKQLELLETFNRRSKKAGEAIKDGIKVTSFDRTSVGPSFTKIMGLQDSMSFYDTYAEYTELTEEEIKAGEVAPQNTTARLLVGDKSFVRSIYPEFFGDSDKSSYPLLQNFYNDAFKSVIESFQSQFINTSDAWRNFKRDFYRVYKLVPNEVMDREIDNFLNYVITADFNDYYKEEFSKTLGIDNQVVLTGNLTIEQFKELSAAQKVWYLKNNRVEELATDEYHILNILNPQLKPEIKGKDGKKTLVVSDYDRNDKMHLIRLDASTTNFIVDDYIKDSFTEMLESADDFMRETALDLINYAIMSNGIQYEAGSFAKYIPNNYLIDIGYGDYLRKKAGDVLSDPFYFADKMDTFILNYASNTDLIPVVRTEYEQDFEQDGEAFKVKGSTKKREKVDWNKVNVNEVLTVPLSALSNEGDKVKGARYINVCRGFKYQIYKRLLSDESGYESDKYAFYLPVNNVTNRNYINLYGESFDNSKNVPEGYDEGIAMNSIKDIVSKEDKSESRQAFGNEQSLTEYEERKNSLIEKFEKAGVTVEVEEDFNLSNAGQIQGNKITINPSKMMGDTIFHEFGHILVDSIDNELRQAGFLQVAKTALYNQVAELYPDLTTEELEREVLTTAVGIEADKLFNEEKDKSNWRIWLSNLFRKLGKLVGIEESVAKQLARELVSKDLSKTIRLRLDSKKREQRVKEQIKNFNWNNEFLEDALTDLQTILDTKQSAYDIPKMQEIKQVMEDMMVDNEVKSLNAYAKWITLNVANLENQFANYEDFTYDKYKAMTDVEKNNLVSFLRESKEFLHHARKVESLEVLKDAPSNVDTKVIIDTLKSIEPQVSNLRNKWFNLSQEFAVKYVELSANPEFGGKGNVEKVDKFFSPQMDETFMQLHLDALFDTNNPLVANLIKQYNYQMFKAHDETLVREKNWKEWTERLKSVGLNANDFVREDGRVIQEIDYYKYNKERYEFFNNLLKKTDSDTDLYKSEVAKWFEKNTVRKDKKEQERIAKEKQAYMTTAEYTAWKATVLRKIPVGDTDVKVVFMNEFSKPNPKIYRNETYDNLLGVGEDKTEKQKLATEFYNYMTNELSYLVEHTQDNIIKQGYIPAVPSINVEGFKDGVEQVLKNLGFGAKGKVQDAGRFDADGEIVQHLPLAYVELLAQEKLEPIPDGITLEEAKEIRKRNNEVKKANREAHAKATVNNLTEVMPLFIKEAIKHKYKTRIENEMLVTKELLKQSKVLKTNGIGQVVRNLSHGKISGKDPKLQTIKGDDSKTYQHLDMWMKMVFYGEFELDEGKMQQLSALLKNYASLRGIGFNYIAGANNYLYAKTQLLTETAGNQFFGAKAHGKAVIDFNKNLGSYIAAFVGNSTGADYSSASKTSAIIHYFDVMQTADEFDIQRGNKAKAFIDKAMMFRNFAFFQQHIGEFTVQNEALLAMMNETRIVDGKLLTYKDYLEELYKKEGAIIDKNKASIEPLDKETVTKRRKIRKNAKEEFAKYKSLYEAIDFKDKKLNLEELGLDANELADFKNKVIGVNQYLHGIYNKDDASTLQHYALGRLAMQFRKWMRPGWNKRFGARFGESYFNERRSTNEEGMYVSTFNFLAKPAMENFQIFDADKNFVMFKAFGNMIVGYKDYLKNISVHWESLDESQRANIRRSIAEMLLVISIVLAAALIRKKKKDDDDDSAAINYAMYQVDRLRLELMTYTPVYGWFNEGKKLLRSPAATVTVLEDAIRVLADIMNMPFIDSEEENFKSGIYHGQSKLDIHTRKLIPAVNQFQRLKNFKNEVRYYRLF